VASLIVALESVIITSVIDAMEGRDVEIADVTGSYMHKSLSEDDNEVWMDLDGVLTEIMVNVVPNLYSK